MAYHYSTAKFKKLWVNPQNDQIQVFTEQGYLLPEAKVAKEDEEFVRQCTSDRTKRKSPNSESVRCLVHFADNPTEIVIVDVFDELPDIDRLITLTTTT